MKQPRRGGYVYPFSSSATTGRIDQGVDFGGSGTVVALGDAVITKIGAPGWPGGAGILYRLLNGPQRGRYVYTYEGVKPSVRVGQRVSAGSPIGTIIPGTSTGIESGWATASGEPVSHAEYHEGLETRAGKQFAAFLLKLKAEHGALTGHTPIDEATGAPQKGVEALGGVASNLPGEVLSGLTGIFGEHAESFALNVVLLLGGAFLIYYGAALMFGVRAKSPAAIAKGLTP